MIDRKALRENNKLDPFCREIFTPVAPLITPGEQGVAKLDTFKVDPLGALNSIATDGEEYVPPGTYARLRVNGELMMSDTPMEQRTNLEVVDRAKGRVLIAGLGIGMVLRAILDKPQVERVIVLEKYQEVIDLVLPTFETKRDLIIKSRPEDFDGVPHAIVGAKLEVIAADVFTWTPPNALKFDTIYFDIWPNSRVCYVPEMEALHKQFRPYRAKGGWMDSWTYRKLKAKQRDDEKFLRHELPRLLYARLKEDGPEKFRLNCLRLLAAPEIDDETKLIVRDWLKDHGVIS
jgi:hypothetical protein